MLLSMGVGAILYQETEEGKRYVDFAAKAFNKAQAELQCREEGVIGRFICYEPLEAMASFQEIHLGFGLQGSFFHQHFDKLEWSLIGSTSSWTLILKQGSREAS